MFGRLRNGQAWTAYSAHALWQGGSDDTPLIPHMGPRTNVMCRSRLPPHTQHSFFLTASTNFRPSATRNSGWPSIQATNQGTGKPRATGRSRIESGTGTCARPRVPISPSMNCSGFKRHPLRCVRREQTGRP